MALNLNSAAVSAFNRALTLVSTLGEKRRQEVLAGFNNAATSFINVPSPSLTTPSSGGSSSGGGGGGSSGGGHFGGNPVTQTCFPAGHLVLMEDETWKPIEDIQVGERVLGRWGEVNTVLALDQPLLGNRVLFNINDVVLNTGDHPTWTSSGWAVADMREYLEDEYKQPVPVIWGDGTVEEVIYHGITPEDVNILEVGNYVGSVGTELYKPIWKLEPVKFPSDTQLYALMCDGSHMINVNGLDFSAWARDDDYDYKSKLEDEMVFVERYAQAA